MTTAKYEVEKFDGQNRFNIWRNKIRQQGLAKILDGKVPSTEERKELKEKDHSSIFLSLSNGVLREVINEEIATGL